MGWRQADQRHLCLCSKAGPDLLALCNPYLQTNVNHFHGRTTVDYHLGICHRLIIGVFTNMLLALLFV